MELHSCINCGANEFTIKNGFKICSYCKTKFDYSIKKTINSEISLKSDIEILLDKCKRNPKNAYKYANLILDIDPTNKEAKKILNF